MKVVYLFKGFVKGKLRGIYKLLLANSSLARKYLRKSHAAGGNSLYCYGIWMQHLKYWSKLNHEVPKVVVEIGPGNSLGVGLVALISGSQTLFALERIQFCNADTNIRVFDELVTFFKAEKKTNSIDQKETKDTSEKHQDFPSQILTKAHLSECLLDERLDAIRKELAHPEHKDNIYVHTIIPWNSADVIEENAVDYIFSNTVLQHIDDLQFAYSAMNKWLKQGGCMSHRIDFKSMNTTKLWNEHWTLNTSEWHIVTGGRSLINREPLSTHLKLLEEYDFEFIHKALVSKENTLSVEDLTDDFKHLDQTDLTTSGLYYFAQLK